MGNQRGALLTLAIAAFVYITSEVIPIGLLPEIAAGLDTSEASVGLLLTTYAAVVGGAVIPFTAWTLHIDRRKLFLAVFVLFTVSQTVAALAPSFEVLMASRLLTAIGHGVFWSTVASVAARLAPAGQSGRAASIVVAGNSAALVLGAPLTTAIGQATSWRWAFGALALAAGLCVVGMWKFLPALPSEQSAARARPLQTASAILRNRGVVSVGLFTAFFMAGHYALYTYTAPIVRDSGGIEGSTLTVLLLGFGAVSLVGNMAMGLFVDRYPGLVMVGSIATIIVAVVALTLSSGAVPTIVTVLLWGVGFSALPLSVQAAMLRVAPGSEDAASSILVVSFQVGIGAGSLIGERLVSTGNLSYLPVLTIVIAVISLLAIPFARSAFPLRKATRTVPEVA